MKLLESHEHLVKTDRKLSGQRAGAYAAVAALVGAVVVISIFAAGTPTAFEAESGVVASPATKVAVTGGSGNSAVKFGAAATPTPTPTVAPTPTATPAGGKPSAANTGVPAGTALTTVNGNVTVTTNGTTINAEDIKGFLIIKASNVTVKNTLIEGGVATGNGGAVDIQSGTGTILDHITIAMAHPSVYIDGIWGSDFTGKYMNISGVVDGMKPGSNVTVQNSWIHGLSYFASDPNQGGGETHNDGIQILSGSNIVIQDNYLQSGSNDNSAVQITQDFGAVSNVTMQRNWADGGGCTFNIAQKGAPSLGNIFAYSNRFGRNSGFTGCAILIGTKVTLTQSGNVFDDNGQAISIQQHD